ncbi:MAG: hypothetical protein V4511_15650 [Bacteroidota bacterium]
MNSANLDSTHYANLILNIALTTPEFASPKYRNIVSEKGFKSLKEFILRKREVKDSALGITLRIHSWTYDGGQSFSKIIIYVSNGVNFEYAFPFLDEYYYYLERPEYKNNEEVQYLFYQRRNFITQLNYVTYSLGLNKPSRIKELNSFVTLLTDSLLGMKEIKLKDIDYLKQYLNKELSKKYKEKPCLDSVSQNINSIISDLQNNKDESIRYFRCKEGSDAYWKFKFNEEDSSIVIHPTFENKECYMVVLW